MIQHTCKHCGESFSASRNGRKYCSRECYWNASRKWTDDVLDFAARYSETHTNREIAQIVNSEFSLNVTRQGVKKAFLRNGIERSEEARHRILRRMGKQNSANQEGANNPNWKGGVSQNAYRYRKRQVERHPNKIKARRKVRYAIRVGNLERQPCEQCGKTNDEETIHAHHDDYEKPLDVRWLCRQCHREEHGGTH